MNYSRLAAVILLLTSTSGQAEEPQPFKKLGNEEPLRKMLAEYSELKDPFTVQFRRVYVRDVVSDPKEPPKHIYCGELNAKNSYGSYAGWSRFVALDAVGKPAVRVADKESDLILINLFCKDAPASGEE